MQIGQRLSVGKREIAGVINMHYWASPMQRRKTAYLVGVVGTGNQCK